MDTPLIVRMDEAKKSIVDFINDIMQQHQLPCYFYSVRNLSASGQHPFGSFRQTDGEHAV